MKCDAKGFVLMARHLRKYNGATVKLFDGRRGKIAYPYILISEGTTKSPLMIENLGNYQVIHQVILNNKVLAERRCENGQLKIK